MGNKVYEKYVKAWNQTPKGKFTRQKANAKQRNIAWELSFEQWWSIWEKSGKWEKRGTSAKSYCMARINDEGPYAVDNVKITTMQKNSQFNYSHGLGL